MHTLDLKIGMVYHIWHKRKGEFTAQLIGVEPADVGDAQDTELLLVKYDVRAGTDQQHLAVVPGKDQVRTSRLRPSLIQRIEPVEGEHWLRSVRVPEEDKLVTQPKQGKLSRWVSTLLGRKG